jgi:hypothetical protein
MKKIFLLLGILSITVVTMACPVCEKNQPKLLKGITHGAGPGSQWDYLIIFIMTGIVLGTLFVSVKYLIRPGEKNNRHIKNLVLNMEKYEG